MSKDLKKLIREEYGKDGVKAALLAVCSAYAEDIRYMHMTNSPNWPNSKCLTITFRN